MDNPSSVEDAVGGEKFRLVVFLVSQFCLLDVSAAVVGPDEFNRIFARVSTCALERPRAMWSSTFFYLPDLSTLGPACRMAAPINSCSTESPICALLRLPPLF